MRPAGSVLAEVGVVARGMVAGARHLVQRRRVASAMGVQALCRTLYGVLTLATLLLYSRYFFTTTTRRRSAGSAQVVVVGSLGAVAGRVHHADRAPAGSVAGGGSSR